MNKIFRSKSILGLVLVLSLLFSSVAPAFTTNAAEAAGSNGYRFEKVDNSAIKVSGVTNGEAVKKDTEVTISDKDEVRVSIVLDGAAAIDKFSTEDMGANDAALSFIASTKKQQKTMEKKIAKAIKGELKVQWNLTVAANIISADVQYGDLEAIASVSGVKQVIVETKYLPCSPEETADPNMAISTGVMTGAQQAWAQGMTGAGGRIAIIDTGLDIDHQSFNNDAFLYALKQNAIAKGLGKNAKSVQKYIDSLKLLNAAEIAKVFPHTNAYEKTNGTVTADMLVISEKIPFAFNYVDINLNVRHIYDSQGEHGSHVAGIAAANRFLSTEKGFADALTEVSCVGNAPDAQVMVMKVFGQQGGAYDSDYMAAIEDAILLGADSVNLSLGSSAPGFSYSTSYQGIMDKLVETDTVVVISAGNSGAWADSSYVGNLYADDVNYDTAGSPGSFSNAFTVASVNNYGMVGKGFEVGGHIFSYAESAEYGNKPFATLAGDTAHEYVFLNAIGAEEDYEGIDVNGKIVFVSRGTTSFYEKANIAAANGAIATVIYNNQEGELYLNLTGYEYTAPCVAILLSDAGIIREASKEAVTADGVSYFTGTMTVSAKDMPFLSKDKYLTMSSFSSWGVPGNLILKPEITAPGGNIWSVNGTNNAGGGVDQYELMSGTSMAAPQVTGMMAVLKRYLETNLTKKYSNITLRALAQSLLMSTASPMVDQYGYPYAVFQQGAGLANVADAMNAASFIIMNEDATASAIDGKVKAELGDDPDKTGVYSFGFTLTNLTNAKHSYALSDAFFTQYVANGLLQKDTDFIETNVTYFVNGTNVSVEPVNPYAEQLAQAQADYDKAIEKAEAATAQVKNLEKVLENIKASLTKSSSKLAALKTAIKEAENAIKAAVKAEADASKAVVKAGTALSKAKIKADSWKAPYEVDTVTLKPQGTAKIEVVIELTEDTKQLFDAEYVNGAYVEGYIMLDAMDDTASHSIPVLAYYGNWTDPSMFDKGSYEEYKAGVENRYPYLYNENNLYGNCFTVQFEDGGEFYFGGNLYANEKGCNPFHNALNNINGDIIKSLHYTLIRNADARAVIFSDFETGEIYDAAIFGSQIGAYYNANSGKWQNTNYRIDLNWNGTDGNNKKLPEGTKVIISLVALPEYYVTEDGDLNLGDCGSGAFFSTLVTIDNTAPEIIDIDSIYNVFGEDIGVGDGIVIEAYDNECIAAVEVYSNGGDELLCSKLVAGNGLIAIPELAPDVYLIRVIDYAGNASAYRMFLNVEPTDEVEGIMLSADELALVKGNSKALEAKVAPATLYDRTVSWKSSDESVAVVNEYGVVTAVGVGECDITASAVMNPEFEASCHVNVIEINVDLNGFVWDEKGDVWFSKFNTANLPAYDKIASVDAPINGLVYGPDGETLYATGIDTQSGSGYYYTVNPDTFELSQVGETEVFYADIAEAPALGAFVGVYFNYILFIDPSTGEYVSAQNYGVGNLVGVSYAGSVLNTYYGQYIDIFYLLDEDGNVYQEAFINLGGSYYYFMGAEDALIGNTGIECDIPYFQSMYYDGEFLFVSNFIEANDVVTLYAIDIENTGEIFILGQFAEGVWPVAALSQLTVSDGYANVQAERYANAAVKAEAATAAIIK